MVGKKINNYELRELVGDGAMGVVYLAEHPILRRRVAVKVLKRQYLESPSLVLRFVNEARAAAAIHHPNVIEVIDVGMIENEVPYIMMEFLDGEPLSRRLARERMGVGKAIDIAIQAARAVAASHAIEIVHRDLKPENLFLVGPDVARRRSREGAGLRDREVASGLGRQRRCEDAHRRHLRNAGVHVARTVPRAERRGRRGDRCLRAGLHPVRMPCGRAPYVSPGAWGDVLMMHMSDDIRVPSTDNPRVPPALDKVVCTALAKNKAERFATMRDMHRALAHSRNDVQDTPAPMLKTDPLLPAIVLGVDERGRRSSGAPPAAASVATPVHAANDVFASQEAVVVRSRGRMRAAVVGGAIVLAAIAGIAVVLRHPAAPAQAVGGPAVAAPPQVAPPPRSREAPTPVTAHAAPNPTAVDDEAAEPTAAAAKTNAGGMPRQSNSQGDDDVEVASPICPAKRSRQVVGFRAA